MSESTRTYLLGKSPHTPHIVIPPTARVGVATYPATLTGTSRHLVVSDYVLPVYGDAVPLAQVRHQLLDGHDVPLVYRFQGGARGGHLHP